MITIPYGRQEIDADDEAAVLGVLRSPFLTQGPAVAEFEAAVADYVGARYAVAVANGTAALHLACLAAGLGSGQRLLTSPNTFVASANCALYAGAGVGFVDIDPETLNMDLALLKRALGEHPDANVVIPVHFAGAPCEMSSVAECCRERGVSVIEDACHALGARYPTGERVGSCRYSQMTVFSFHPVKPVTTGEGGMVTTNDPGLYERLVDLRTHGITRSPSRIEASRATTDGMTNPWYYEMQALGYNYRMNDLEAALGRSQLAKLDRFLERRRALAQHYDSLLEGYPEIHLCQRPFRSSSAHHLYVIRSAFAPKGKTRASLMHALQRAGIGTQVHYIPVHLQPYYQKLGFKAGDFPQAERYYDEALSLPLYVSLSEEQQHHVVSELVRWLQ